MIQNWDGKRTSWKMLEVRPSSHCEGGQGKEPQTALVVPQLQTNIRGGRSEWEKDIDATLEEGGHASWTGQIGKRARGVIQSAAPQLRRYKDSGLPLLIFAMDLTWHGHLCDVKVEAAMFGQPIVRFHFGVGMPNESHSSYGHAGKRQMTEVERRYISAFCVFRRNTLGLNVYHNPFAFIPLMPRYLPHPDDKHFVKDTHPDSSQYLWNEYVGPRDVSSRTELFGRIIHENTSKNY